MFLGRFGFIGKHKVVRECKAEVEGDIVFKTFLNIKKSEKCLLSNRIKKKNNKHCNLRSPEEGASPDVIRSLIFQ